MLGSLTARIRSTVSRNQIPILLTLIFALAVPPSAFGQVVQTYYIPMPEDAAVLSTMDTLDPDGGEDPNWPVTTQISISISEDGTLIYWDHTEDGYEADISAPVQASTEIWGDDDATNGIPPGYVNDVLFAGQVIFIEEAIPEFPSGTYHNGGDKLAVTAPISLTRGSYASDTGSLLAGAVHVGAVEYDNWGTEFIAPVGVDMSDSVDDQMFEYTALYVQAQTSGTRLHLNGVEITGTGLPLDEGRGYTIENVEMGDQLTSNYPIQVYLITGDIGTTWELRWYTLLPTAVWHNEYYSPVGTGINDVGDGPTQGCTSVWLHNPNASAITVNFEYGDGSSCSVDVPANDSIESTEGTCTGASAGAYRDEFSSQSYSNSDGTLDWNYSWVEFNDNPNGSAGNGYVYISGGELVMRGSGVYDTQRYIRRQVNLATAASATLSFAIDTSGDLGSSDWIRIRVSGNGGSSWRTLETIYNDVDATRSYNLLSSELTSNAIIEFRTYNYGSGSYYEYHYIDNVQIEATGLSGTYDAPSIPDGSGARFWSAGNEPFLAISTTDCDGSQIFDWGFPLIPADQLTPQVLVGGAPGCTDSDCGGGQNRSPVWITPIASTRIYVDRNGAGYNCDPSNLSPVYYDANALESVKIEDTVDNDMTAALIFTCDDTAIAAAWGQNPLRSYSGDQQGLDMGTVILPLEKLFTPALIASFDAYPNYGRTIVEWTTASETGTVGFHLLKKDPDTGLFKRLNNTILPALPATPQGGTYQFADPDGSSAGTREYKLIAVEKNGKQIGLGPFAVEVGTGTGKANRTLRSMAADVSYQALPNGISANKQNRTKALQEAKALSNSVKKARKGRTLKLAVKEEGLYYLSVQTIADKMDKSDQKVRDWLSQGKLCLMNQGKKVAYLPAEDNAGIYFYGRAPESQYSAENIYWLTKRKGWVMKTEDDTQPYSPAYGEQSYSATQRLEINRYAMTALFEDPEADYWTWEFVIANDPVCGTRSFNLPFHGLASEGKTTVEMELLGATGTTHQAQIRLNGYLIGESSWKGLKPKSLKLKVPDDILVDGENTLTVTGELAPETDYSIFYVNFIDITYPRNYQAHQDRLLFKNSGHWKLTVSGFSDPQILLFDISKKRKPIFIAHPYVQSEASGYRISFYPDKAKSRFLAAAQEAVITDFEIWADTASDLTDKKNQADYLIIAPSHLMTAAQQLADYRHANGYRTMVVDLEDIYDEVNEGNASPYAIKAFLAYANQNWQSPPRFVVLAGEGTYDYKDNMGQGDNLIPVLMVDTPHGLFASDNSFADFNNDGVPEMAIGRMPAGTPDELLAMVAKIAAFETGGAWKNRVLLAADIPDDGGNFPADSDAVGGLIPTGYDTTKVYAEHYDTAGEANTAMKASINAGALLTNFIGHSGMDRLGSQGMLTSADVPSLNNAGQYPILTAMTCIAGRFSTPGIDSIGELLVLNANAGAAAVWAPTGLSLNDEAMLLNKGFMESFFQQPTTVGETVRDAITYAKSRDIMEYMPRIYNLLGDPALMID